MYVQIRKGTPDFGSLMVQILDSNTTAKGGRGE